VSRLTAPMVATSSSAEELLCIMASIAILEMACPWRRLSHSGAQRPWCRRVFGG
jgi:hypothetical protein